MKCPVCGCAELNNEIKNIEYSYKGKTTTILQVKADFCPACDEIFTDETESRRVMQAMSDFQKQVIADVR